MNSIFLEKLFFSEQSSEGNVQDKGSCYIFLLIAFFLGTWGALFNVVQTSLIVVGLIYNIIKYKVDFIKNIKDAKYYIWVSVGFLFYMGFQTLFIMNNEKYTDLKPGFGIFESGFSFFLLGALYVISLKSFITLRLLKQFLWIFCISVFTFNFVILFYLTGTDFFTNIGAATSYLYDSRFGSTKLLLGGKVYLDAQALHIYAAALFAYFLAILQRNRAEKIIAFVFFVVFIWFLSLTVTKSSILSFLCGFMVLNICFYKKIFHYKWLLIGVFVLLGVIGGIFMPSSFGERWQQLKSEINDVREGNLAGGSSITPRVVFYKSCFDHFDTFALWGLGVYTNPVSKQWYRNSGNSVVAKLTHSHNSYLQYWMIGGIPGLLFILSWFIFPLWRMIKNKCYCFLTLAIMLAFFIDCNNEVLLIVSDSTPVIIFFLAMFYIHNDKFCLLEKSLGQVKE